LRSKGASDGYFLFRRGRASGSDDYFLFPAGDVPAGTEVLKKNTDPWNYHFVVVSSIQEGKKSYLQRDSFIFSLFSLNLHLEISKN
jgi:hypothetical protein